MRVNFRQALMKSYRVFFFWLYITIVLLPVKTETTKEQCTIGAINKYEKKLDTNNLLLLILIALLHCLICERITLQCRKRHILCRRKNIAIGILRF